jgi:hypothetical protein
MKNILPHGRHPVTSKLSGNSFETHSDTGTHPQKHDFFLITKNRLYLHKICWSKWIANNVKIKRMSRYMGKNKFVFG